MRYCTKFYLKGHRDTRSQTFCYPSLLNKEGPFLVLLTLTCCNSYAPWGKTSCSTSLERSHKMVKTYQVGKSVAVLLDIKRFIFKYPFYFIRSLVRISILLVVYLVGKSIAVLLHRKDLIWKVPILLHTEPRPYLIMACSVGVCQLWFQDFPPKQSLWYKLTLKLLKSTIW